MSGKRTHEIEDRFAGALARITTLREAEGRGRESKGLEPSRQGLKS